MKIKFLYFQSSKEHWAEEALAQYNKKISSFLDFEVLRVKSKSFSREEKKKKLQWEEEKLLSYISKEDVLILFDELSKSFASVIFSKKIQTYFDNGHPKIIFVIGGPYGFTDDIKTRANLRVSLSEMTMNHHVAQVVALEQIYRALTIQRGLPYHNS